MIHRYEILEIDTKLAKSLIQRIMIQHKMESEMLKNRDDKTFNFCKWHSRYKKSQFCHLLQDMILPEYFSYVQLNAKFTNIIASFYV